MRTEQPTFRYRLFQGSGSDVSVACFGVGVSVMFLCLFIIKSLVPLFC